MLRFEHDDEPTMYRVIVLNRNLTYDRSWDGNDHPTQKGAQWDSALNWSAVFVGRYIGPAVPVTPPSAAPSASAESTVEETFGDQGLLDLLYQV